MTHAALAVIASVAALGAADARAADDPPPFDRPGLAFSTGTIPSGTFLVEQGLPDVQRGSKSDDAETLYTFDSRLRAGLTDAVEVQLATSLVNSMQSHDAGQSHSADGAGDTSIALKAALPSASERFSWATLAAVTFANGANHFTNGDTAYDLGVAVQRQLGDDLSAELYVNVDRLDGATSVQLSPNLNVSLSDSLLAFVELGASIANGGTDSVVAGGGFAWMVTPAVQLDVSADVGLNDDSPSLLAGFGVSIFFR